MTINGECSFTWTPVAGGVLAAVDAGATSRCSPGAHTLFTFDGMQTYNGSVDPFPGAGIEVVFTTATMVANLDGGIVINGTGTLGTSSGSEAMSFSYTGTR